MKQYIIKRKNENSYLIRWSGCGNIPVFSESRKEARKFENKFEAKKELQTSFSLLDTCVIVEV